MTFQRDAFVFGHIEQSNFIVSAGQHDVRLEEIKVDDVCVLIGMIFGLELEVFFILAIFVLEEETVGISTVKEVLEGFYFIEGRNVAITKGLWVGILDWFGDRESRLLLNHFNDFYKRR